jgi:hypothetical protein
MITCGDCGKVSGEGATGSSWICEDCRIEPPKKEQSEPAEQTEKK